MSSRAVHTDVTAMLFVAGGGFFHARPFFPRVPFVPDREKATCFRRRNFSCPRVVRLSASSKLPAAFLAALLCAVSPVSARTERPFLIVREDMYGELRGRAAREPWAGIAKSAVEGAAGSLGYSPDWSFLYTCRRLVP